MTQDFDFYDARANEAAVEAEQAKLVMVRERALRAEKTWRGLADQAKNVAHERAKAERFRAQRLAAQAPEPAS
jgi:hypothetical protein